MSSRFECPSMSLTLRGLFTRRTLWSCLVVALVLHTSLAQLKGMRAQREVTKPLTTRFVKRQPRLTKPLELKKRPRPRQRQIRRRMVAVQVKGRREGPASFPEACHAVGSLARPGVRVGRWVSFEMQDIEPDVLAEVIEGTKDPDNRIDMVLDMVDIEALDTGQYHAMVIQDPKNKRNIKGFFHLAIAYPKSMRRREHHQFEDRIISGILRLAQKMNEWTSVRTDVTKRLGFDSAELFKTPWVHLGIVFGMEPTEEEAERLGQYLARGGFFFGEGSHRFSSTQGPQLGYVCLISFVDNALRSQGHQRDRDWSLERLPNTHSIFHCYYDFDGGPPAGSSLVPTWMAGSTLSHPDGKGPVARGIYLDNRLAVIATNQMYGVCWGDWGRITIGGRDYYAYLDPARVLQFGINTIIFALTQEGSITHRLMESLH